MDDADELGALRQMVTTEMEKCKNPDTLDLIYKILIIENT